MHMKLYRIRNLSTHNTNETWLVAAASLESAIRVWQKVTGTKKEPEAIRAEGFVYVDGFAKEGDYRIGG